MAKTATATKAAPKTKTATATKEVAQAAHRMVDELSNRVEPVEIRARKGADQAAQTASEKVEKARESAQTALDRFENSVRERPMAAAGIAFGVGFLTSLLLRRK